MYKLTLLALCLLKLEDCICPTSEAISRKFLYTGTWKSAGNGEYPGESVIGAVDPIDNEQQLICRHPQDGNMIPGKLVPSYKTCYIPRSGKEWGFSQYEVLTNDDGFDLYWIKDSYGNFPDNAIIGGFASGWPMIICRAWHKGRESKMRHVSGKLDVDPNHECCYIPYAGKEHCYKEYEVLVAKD